LGYYILKIAISAVLIVIISEIGKRNSFAAAVLASIPLVSVLAMVWLYIDTRDTGQIIKFSYSVFWLVIPSLVLFVTLPAFLKQEISFYMSLCLSIIITIVSYFIMVTILKKFEINL